MVDTYKDAYYEMYAYMKESIDKFPKLVNSLGQSTASSAQAYASVDEELQSSLKGAL